MSESFPLAISSFPNSHLSSKVNCLIMGDTPTSNPSPIPQPSFDFSIPFPSPALVTPTTGSNSHSPPSSHLYQRPLNDYFDPYSDALHQQMSTPYLSSSRPGWKPSPPESVMGPPLAQHYGSSLPPPNIFYGSEPVHHYPPPLEYDRLRPPVGLALPPPTPFTDRGFPSPLDGPQHYQNNEQRAYDPSPYNTPALLHPNSAGSSGSQAMQEYFPPYSVLSTPGLAQLPYSSAYSDFSPTYQDPPNNRLAPLAPPPVPGSKPPKNGSKTNRQQFSACGACRHRRVKCDLKEQQDALEAKAALDGSGPNRSGRAKRKAICSNCEERGVACV